jgi:hypothetical protein
MPALGSTGGKSGGLFSEGEKKKFDGPNQKNVRNWLEVRKFMQE